MTTSSASGGGRRWVSDALSGLWRRFRPLVLLVAAIWAAHFLNVVLGGQLTPAFGLVPRTLNGLDGVVAMPFLHGSFRHLTTNTTPLLLLGGLIVALWPRRFAGASLLIVLLGGVLTWLFAREHNHIGASGLIFGWFGYLVALGLIERSAPALFGAVIAIAVYGAPTVLGVLPQGDHISWDGHLAGLTAGVAAAWALRPAHIRRPRARESGDP